MKYKYSVGIFFFEDYVKGKWARDVSHETRLRPQELDAWLEIQANTWGAELVSITETGNRLTAIYRYVTDVENDDE